MRILIIIIILFTKSFAQDSVSIIISNGVSKLTAFEAEFMTQVITLYNAKNEDKLNIKFVRMSNYGEIFKRIREASKTDLICAIRAITITEERKNIYDFSYPYMPIKQVLISLKKNYDIFKDWKNPKHVIYANRLTMHWENALELSKKYNLIFYKPKSTKDESMTRYVRSGDIDFYVGDMSDIFAIKDLTMLSNFDGALLSHYGVLYPKNSVLKTKLDRYIKYFAKSPLFYKVIVKHFGTDFASYFKNLAQEMESKKSINF
jgi:ABC-type amino acid transport substrate-binding protein